MVIAAVPEFLSVTGWVVASLVPMVVLANVSVLGEKVAIGACEAPVPVRLTVALEVTALSVIPSEAVRVPVAAGVNLTVIVQVAFTAIALAQVLVSENELASVPEMATLVIDKLAVPVFFTVTAWVAAEAPSTVLAKVSEAGETLATGAVTVTDPVPVPEAKFASPLYLTVRVSVPTDKLPAGTAKV
jgi:hypothetical protein